MSFLNRILGKPAQAADAGQAREIQAFVDELMRIGVSDGFLAYRPGGRFNPQCRHIRARAIGMRLNMMGGSSLMRKVYDRVELPKARQLAAAWDEIGDWAA